MYAKKLEVSHIQVSGSTKKHIEVKKQERNEKTNK